MRHLALLLAAAALTAGCTPDEPILEPSLRVDRLVAGEGCYRVCAGSGSSSLYGEKMCPDGQPAECGFAAGADRIRIVARFDGVEVSPELAPTAPKLTMIADDVTEDESVVVDRTTGTVPLYTAVLRAPATQVDALAFRFEVEDGYEAEVNGLSVSAPVPRLSIFGCSPDEECTRTAGVGKAAVTITVPDGIEPVKLLRWLDDEPQTPLEAAETLVEDGMSTWQLSAAIPDHGEIYRLQASAAGYPSTVSTIQLVPPEITLEVAGCDALSCARPAGVGKALATVRVPSGLGDPSLVTTLDGVLQGTQPLALVTDDGVTAEWQLGVQTPIQEGALWCLDARIGKVSSDPTCITITKPDIQVRVLGCPAAETCFLKQQTQVVIAVTAPEDISPPGALLAATLDGIPQLGQNMPVALTEVNAGTLTGYYSTPVPSFPGKTWQLTARINESQSLPSAPVIIVATGP